MRYIKIGIDNGVSGSIGIVGEGIGARFIKTPIKKELSYQKSKKSYISRIDFPVLYTYFEDLVNLGLPMFASIERPMINSTRFSASISAARSLEATLIILELLKIPYEYCDSKAWQKELLPPGIKGSAEQKKASKDIGIRLFPMFEKEITKHGDADGLLIAEWARRLKK